MNKILFALGILLLALSGWLYYNSLPTPLATVAQEEYEYYDIIPESAIDVTFSLNNPTNQNVQIVSLVDCCAINARFRAKREPPFEIPPRSTYDIVCTLQVFQPGEFSGQIHCYLADPHLREIVLKVSGTVKK